MKTYLLGVGLGLALCSGCRDRTAPVSSKPPESPVPVHLTQAVQGDITRQITLPATVGANRTVVLYSKVAGYLKSIAVDKGDEVKQNDLLAEIEVPELLADLERNRAELEVAELDFNRLREAQEKAPDLIVRQSIDAAKGKFVSARANASRAETLLGFCKIIAPFPGVITRRNVDLGAFIPAGGGSGNGSALLTLSDFKVVRVQIAVPEPEVPFVKNGLAGKVVIEELPGKVFTGTVSRFAQALDDATKTMLAEIDLENKEGQLRPGMFATVRLGVETKHGATLLPAEAVMVEKGGTSIFLSNNGKARKVPVKTGFNDGDKVEILDGVKAGGQVIAPGKTVLADGQSIQVIESK